MLACFFLGTGMLEPIQSDKDTVAADPSQSSVLHGTGPEGTGQSRPFCPDVAHIYGVHAKWHWWVAQTRMVARHGECVLVWGKG